MSSAGRAQFGSRLRGTRPVERGPIQEAPSMPAQRQSSEGRRHRGRLRVASGVPGRGARQRPARAVAVHRAAPDLAGQRHRAGHRPAAADGVPRGHDPDGRGLPRTPPQRRLPPGRPRADAGHSRAAQHGPRRDRLARPAAPRHGDRRDGEPLRAHRRPRALPRPAAQLRPGDGEHPGRLDTGRGAHLHRQAPARLPRPRRTRRAGDGVVVRVELRAERQDLAGRAALRPRQIRKEGWAMQDEELAFGLRSVAAPVYDETGA